MATPLFTKTENDPETNRGIAESRREGATYIMMKSSLFGSGTWVGSSGIRVGSAHPGEEDAWGAWADDSQECDGTCGHVRCPILTPFSLVASSLPPLHSGMVKTQF